MGSCCCTHRRMGGTAAVDSPAQVSERSNSSCPPDSAIQASSERGPPLPRPAQSQMPSICQGCGKEISRGSRYCAKCVAPLKTARIKAAARAASDKAHSPKARAKQAQIEHKRRKKQAEWCPEMQPEWLTESVYWTTIQPALVNFSNSAIASRIGISRCSASHIKAGKLRPHPRHWEALAAMVDDQTAV